ncbi:MAG: nitrile hydratase accessory protein [Roseobacter sp.]
MRPLEPVFTQPWHAQLFALTVHLNESGWMGWPDWADAFGATLKRHGLEKELDGGDDYFAAWLETLEQMIVSKGQAAKADLAQLKADWEGAYLRTPHGAPVHLSE